MSLKFVQGVKIPLEGMTHRVDGLPYIPWALSFAMAGRPALKTVYFEGDQLAQFFFGGAVVAVENEGQRMYLPILNAKNKAIPEDQITTRDITDTINRCRAKSVAVTNGVGMCLYTGYEEQHARFLKELGLRPDSDLTKVEPLTANKGGRAEYVDWGSALTAIRLTDPESTFTVREFDVLDEATGVVRRLPYQKTGNTYSVSVRVNYRGDEVEETLAIMGFAKVQTSKGLKNMDHQPLTNPNVWDWNKAVMRCLAKAIALVSGYGLSVYAQSEAVLFMHQNAEALAEVDESEAVIELGPDPSGESSQEQGEAQDAEQSGGNASTAQGSSSNLAPRGGGRLTRAPVKGNISGGRTSQQQTRPF